MARRTLWLIGLTSEFRRLWSTVGRARAEIERKRRGKLRTFSQQRGKREGGGDQMGMDLGPIDPDFICRDLAFAMWLLQTHRYVRIFFGSLHDGPIFMHRLRS